MKLLARRFRGSPVRLPVAVPDPVSTFMPELQKRHYGFFWTYLSGGIGGLVALSYATVETHSVRLETIFIIAGSLLVPTLYVYYLDLRSHFVDPRWRTLVATFLLGGFVAVPIALVLEMFLPAGTGSAGRSFVTGLIEEFAKALAILWLVRQRHRNLRFAMDGIILGAAAGMGFAAIEDMLYGADAFQHGLSAVVTTVWVRQIFGPFGHGTWTAIVAGTIWRVKGAGKLRLTWSVLVAYLVAAALHGAWDWEPLAGDWNVLWLLGVGVIGLLILRAMVHQALGQEEEYLQRAVGVPDARPVGETT